MVVTVSIDTCVETLQLPTITPLYLVLLRHRFVLLEFVYFCILRSGIVLLLLLCLSCCTSSCSYATVLQVLRQPQLLLQPLLQLLSLCHVLVSSSCSVISNAITVGTIMRDIIRGDTSELRSHERGQHTIAMRGNRTRRKMRQNDEEETALEEYEWTRQQMPHYTKWLDDHQH